MAKKYLALEEAAQILKLAPDELVRLRERGEIRGFADRGTWKFKSEDVEEFARSRQADSSPEVPIIDDAPPRSQQPAAKPKAPEPKKPEPPRMPAASDSDVRLLLDDNLVPGSHDSDPEVTLGASDSDVRLTDKTAPLIDSGSDSDVKIISTASDSDVVLSTDADSADSGSDSDVKLIGIESDSDVRLAKPGSSAGGASDSDVRLVGTDDLATLGSESDIRLATSEGSSMDIPNAQLKKGGSPDSTMAMDLGSSSGGGDSSVLIDDDDDGLTLGPESDMKIGGGSSSDSGITLQSLADSGISLEKSDSGISLAGPMDSGIALDRVPDSGISLADDSGIRLADSGTGKKRDNDRTAPMMNLLDESDDSTQVEVPSFNEDSAYKLQGDRGKDRPETSVVLFAEDEDEAPARPVKGGAKPRVDDSFALQGSGVEFAEAEDFSDDDDLEVAEDVLGDEGDLDEIDVFEPAEEDFDSSVQSGESHAEFAAMPTARTAAPVEADWGGLTFAGLALSGVFLALSGVVMFDLVRTMWHWNQDVLVSGALIDALKGMF